MQNSKKEGEEKKGLTTKQRIELILKIYKQSIPMMSGHVLMVVNSTVFSYLMSQTDNKHLEAVAFTSILESILRDIPAANFSAIAALTIIEVNKDIEQKNHKNVGRIYRQGLKIAFAIGSLSIPMLMYIDKILILAEQDKEMAKITRDYCKGFAIGVIPSLFNLVYRDLFNGLQEPQVFAGIQLINSFMGISSAIALKNGKFGLPNWGAFGISFGGSMANIITMWLCIAYAASKDKYKKYQLFSPNSDKSWEWIVNIEKRGLPIVALAATDITTGLVLNLVLGSLNSEYLLAVGPLSSILTIKILTEFAVSDTNYFFTSTAFDNKELDNIKNLHNHSQFAAILLSLISSAIILGLSKQLLAIFFNEDEQTDLDVAELFFNLAAISIVGGIFKTISIVTSASLTGILDLIATIKINSAPALLIVLPLLLTLASNDTSPEKLMIIRNSGFTISCILALNRYYSLIREVKIQPIKSENESEKDNKCTSICKTFSNKASAIFGKNDILAEMLADNPNTGYQLLPDA